MSVLSDLLGAAGYILDAPGQAVRSLTLGRNPLDGILDETKKVTGRKWLEELGVLQSSDEGFLPTALETVADIGTNPLTYLGPLGVIQAIKEGMGATAAASGGKSVLSRLLPLRRDLTVLDDVDFAIGKPLLRYPTVKVPYDPIGVTAPLETPLDAAKAVVGSKLPGGLIQSGWVGGGSPGLNVTARPVGSYISDTARETADRGLELRQLLRDLPGRVAGQDIAGLYNPAARAAVVLRQPEALLREAAPLAGKTADDFSLPFLDQLEATATRRHEVGHGLIDRAMWRGSVPELPAIYRIPAQLRQSDYGFLRGLGDLTEEMAVRSTELPLLSTGQKVRNALDWLSNPNPTYGKMLGHNSPLLEQMYMERMLHRAPYAAAGALGAAGGAAGLAYLGSGGR